MAQSGREGRLHPAVGTARHHTVAHLKRHLPGFDAAPTGKSGQRSSGEDQRDLESLPLVLVACSGGPDSLALASVAAHFSRRGDLRAGAVVVDHDLQPGSAEQAERAADQCRKLGLEPVRVMTAAVERNGMGPEMAARTARYVALEEAAREVGASAVLLGHTLDDQAETVLLGLSRGSGTRSLAGMPEARELREGSGGPLVLRPLLTLRREDTHAICEAEGLSPWSDPTNEERTFRRNQVRHEVLPYLEDRLGPGISVALSRTASVLGADAELLEDLTDEALRAAAVDPAAYQSVPDSQGRVVAGLSMPALREMHRAIRRRVLARTVVGVGGESPSFERLGAMEDLLEATGKSGPIQLAGHVAVWRCRPLPTGGRRGAAREGALIYVVTD
ncbi:tRNA lysidine(34) synthetase TilS [uncultured Kocuria sp.]|uniref:tRNA lysidine(34) synthetase TilS n=1 Tax=uncultured Kocuria sp. TaxID=259305 RepID=UPI0025930B82|nr:tRNA lysidine(34) synthetase TilS [uncultured Kocuria sp.]MCT1368472.1 tRNA lysidine(34) synthetase TilS [Rothia sp. p3-SID1597]